MAITLYGSPRSRTMRILWTLAELRVDYEHVPLEWDDPKLKSPAYLALNPAGAIPLLVDDGFPIAECMAISLYLTKTYGAGTGLYPDTPKGEAAAWRWSLFAQGQIEPWVQRDGFIRNRPEGVPDLLPDAAARGLAILERALETTDWLGGARFGVADLNVAGVLSPSRAAATAALADHPAVIAWLARCYARAAAVETRARFG